MQRNRLMSPYAESTQNLRRKDEHRCWSQKSSEILAQYCCTRQRMMDSDAEQTAEMNPMVAPIMNIFIGLLMPTLISCGLYVCFAANKFWVLFPLLWIFFSTFSGPQFLRDKTEDMFGMIRSSECKNLTYFAYILLLSPFCLMLCIFGFLISLNSYLEKKFYKLFVRILRRVQI